MSEYKKCHYCGNKVTSMGDLCPHCRQKLPLVKILIIEGKRLARLCYQKESGKNAN